jgi:hypothetical protein
MNIGAPWPDLIEAEERVLAMQTKLHRWAASDAGRVFDDLHNLVYDPALSGVTVGVRGGAPVVIEASAVTVRRGRRVVLSDVSLGVGAGQVVHLAAPTAAARRAFCASSQGCRHRASARCAGRRAARSSARR